MNIRVSLLEFLACRAGCPLLSQLREPDWLVRSTLLHTLEGLPPEAAPLEEWNDALHYLTGMAPETTSSVARAQLIAGSAAMTPIFSLYPS